MGEIVACSAGAGRCRSSPAARSDSDGSDPGVSRMCRSVHRPAEREAAAGAVCCPQRSGPIRMGQTQVWRECDVVSTAEPCPIRMGQTQVAEEDEVRSERVRIGHVHPFSRAIARTRSTTSAPIWAAGETVAPSGTVARARAVAAVRTAPRPSASSFRKRTSPARKMLTPAAEDRGARPAEGREGMLEAAPLGRGDRDDPEQQRQVRVAVADERAAGAADGIHPGERPHGPLVVAAEVEPPEARAQREPERGREYERTVDGEMGGADADGDDRLADRNDDDEPVTLDE